MAETPSSFPEGPLVRSWITRLGALVLLVLGASIVPAHPMGASDPRGDARGRPGDFNQAASPAECGLLPETGVAYRIVWIDISVDAFLTLEAAALESYGGSGRGDSCWDATPPFDPEPDPGPIFAGDAPIWSKTAGPLGLDPTLP